MLFACTDKTGIYRSTDSGMHFEYMGLPELYLHQIEEGPDGAIYVSAVEEGIFRSRDLGSFKWFVSLRTLAPKASSPAMMPARVARRLPQCRALRGTGGFGRYRRSYRLCRFDGCATVLSSSAEAT